MRLGALLWLHWKITGITIRKLGKEMDVDQATLLRFMEGKNPDGETLAKIIRYVLVAAPTGREK